jgi:lactate dehydrogenase-like 2-hydroxyacid dehydrogenase
LFIAAYKGAGYDGVAVDAIKARGIGFSNTPGAVDEATATVALFLLLSTMRNTTWAQNHLRAGNFTPMPELEASSFDLSGKTIGILGLGGIGLRFLKMVQPFGMKVLYHNRKPSDRAPKNAEYCEDIYDLLRRVDVLSVHTPLSPQTKNSISDKEIKTMKKGSIIINTARGGVIDEEALIKALQEGHVRLLKA